MLFADFVDLNRATDIARNFHNSRSSIYSIESVESISDNSSVYLYVFKLSPIGFIVISADDYVMPVLAYSFENNFDSNNPPVQVNYLFDIYKQDIDNIYQENIGQSIDVSNSWNYYSEPFTYIPSRDVAPLLTCNWNQDSPWNDMCPEDQDGPGGNVYAGCVAVSMAQVMYYWQYPQIGYGSHGYNPGGGYGYQYANYGSTEYDYDSMEDNFATPASQLLLYHAGVAVNMGYSPNGSGAWVLSGSNSTYNAMKNYFIYDHSISAIESSNYSTSQYRAYLESDLDNNQPIIYRGCSNDGCHAWNIDGYEDDYFHNNFGWGGSNNGYYLLSALNGFHYDQGALINIVPEQLDEPHIVLTDTGYFEIEGDGDQVVNPGETVGYYTTIENFIPWDDASAVTLILESLSDDIEIENESINVGSLNSGQDYTTDYPFILLVSESASLGSHSMKLHVLANEGEYIESFDVSIDISLFQAGFPYDTFDQIKTNPLILDLDGDNDNDIIFADNMGFVHVIESDGSITNLNFPYDMGDDAWGSAAAEDIDLDGDIEFVIGSKSKYIYIFDKDGLENAYYSDKYILGTPAIGQIDSDPYFEIVVGGYGPGSTSNNELFAINHDATDVYNFPIVIGEKIKSGVALADFNNNGYDDIVFGTDSGNLFMIYDSGLVAEGFPISLNDKIQSEPSILEYNGDKIIFVGSKDDNFYSINSNGEIRFSIETGGNIYTSPSFLNSNQGLMIFFGSDDGMIYSVDMNGDSFPGWPIYLGDGPIGSIVFGDIDGDGDYNIISSVNSEIRILNEDGSDFIYNSIIHDLPLASAPTVIDLNNDGNLEVIVGTGTDLSSVDFKFESNYVSDWNMHRCNSKRTGFYVSTEDVNLGDINQDLVADILDIVILINFAIGNTEPSSYEFYLSDINSDGNIDVLDVVMLVNLIL
tara:strand:- start:207 stop:2981 length:2775 start_codon:yes stop_codon:yes gene_type:complete